MPHREIHFPTPPSAAELNNAEFMTLGIACDLDREAKGKPELAVILANSAIAAAHLVLSRHGVTEENRQELYELFWAEMVERNTER